MTVAEPATDQLSNFTADPHGFIERLCESGKPSLLTHEGRPACVVMGVAAWEKLLNQMERLDVIACVRQGQLDFAEGRSISLEEARELWSKKHNLPSLATQ